MSKSITINVPARKISWGGKTQTFSAFTRTVTQDDAGQWSAPDTGLLTQADVIDMAQRASNWPEIRSVHFPMHGFHN
jgi:hypothetical protein